MSDLVIRNDFLMNEYSYFFHKSLIASQHNPANAKAKAFTAINHKMRKFSITRQRCKSRIDGRARHVETSARLSRMPLRFLSGDGYLKGISRRGI